MNILFVIDTFQVGGGATQTMCALADQVTKKGHLVAISCRKVLTTTNGRDIIVGNGSLIIDYFIKNEFQIIHWFKTGRVTIFRDICKLINKRNLKIPILTTVCQNPSFEDFLLTPFEIRYSSLIIYIDRTSFDGKFSRYIKYKKMIYFGSGTELLKYIERESEELHDRIIFGRGSSLNKCPKDMISNFDNINIENKEFHIVGIIGKDNWIKRYISKKNRTDIFVYPQFSFDKWIKKLMIFDIFLYQLPLDAYSSIDGTLQQAMLLMKPVVYYGPDAPKELIEHGKSGFIANKKEDIAYYAELLAKNEALRKEMGYNARQRILNNFSFSETVSKYTNVYAELISMENRTISADIPLEYQMFFYVRKFKYAIIHICIRIRKLYWVFYSLLLNK